MQRFDILNLLSSKYGYEDYLEVGSQYLNNFNRIQVKNKTSVEPYPPEEFKSQIDYLLTSDDYFEQLDKDVKFDLVFIDGLHHWEQVIKDVENSLDHLKEGGSILCHDCLPTTEREQLRDDPGGSWMGDVWKAMFVLMKTRPDLEINIINTDCGCGLIQRGKQMTVNFDDSDMDWNFYLNNRNRVLSIISPSDFIKKLNG